MLDLVRSVLEQKAGAARSCRCGLGGQLRRLVIPFSNHDLACRLAFLDRDDLDSLQLRYRLLQAGNHVLQGRQLIKRQPPIQHLGRGLPAVDALLQELDEWHGLLQLRLVDLAGHSLGVERPSGPQVLAHNFNALILPGWEGLGNENRESFGLLGVERRSLSFGKL